MLQNWKSENGAITKEFMFQNFMEAIHFVNEIAKLAEAMNHHPNIFLHDYKQVKIILTTHSKGMVTEKDNKLAAQIDEIL